MVIAMVALSGCAGAAERDTSRVRDLRRMIEKLEPLHEPLGKPQPGDWLWSHDEPGQTFDEYVRGRPVRPTGKRRVIYVQPLGPLTDTQRQIITLSAEFLGHYYDRPVKIRDDLPLSLIPTNARRKHPEWGVDQILSTYVLDKVLKPRLPDDAAAYIAFTAIDLWPGEGWNFVFGQASLRDRVGVWSINRNGDPDEGEDEFRLCLLRTLRTATHETGHMFSVKHCIQYECNMCGSNHREESDRRPLYLCPHCVAKVCYATEADPVERYQSLANFCHEHDLREESDFYQKSIDALTEQ